MHRIANAGALSTGDFIVSWLSRNTFSFPAGKLSPDRGEPPPDWMLPGGNIHEKLQ